MELKINVDETMFKEVIEKELEAFSKEELHEIIRNCMIEALKTDGMFKELFVEPNYSSYSYNKNQPTQLLKDAAKSIDLSPAYKEIQDLMINDLKNNYHTMLENVMLSTMAQGLCNDWNFKNTLENQMRKIISSNNAY